MRRSILILLALVVSVAALAAQSGTLRPRFGSRAGAAIDAPTLLIHTPTTSGVWTLSDTTLEIGGSASDDTLIASVGFTRTSGTCTPASGTATGTTQWSFTITFSGTGVCAYGVQATDDGALTSPTRTITVTRISPDTENPVVEITSSSAEVALAAYTLAGTCSDDVQCVRVAFTCPTCAPSSGDATLSGNGSNFTQPLTFSLGDNTMTVIGYDAEDKASVEDQIIVRYDLPLVIGTTNLPSCTVGVVCHLPALVVSGGDGAVTFQLDTGTFPDDFALDTADGSISGTCSGTSSTAITIAATDQEVPTPEQDTQDYTIICAAAAAETAHTYFEFQTSNRVACSTSTNIGTNCSVQLVGPDGPCLGPNGGCGLRSIAELNNINTKPITEANDRFNEWTYIFGIDTYGDKQDAAKLILSGEDRLLCDGARGTGCQDPAEGYKPILNITPHIGGAPGTAPENIVMVWDIYAGVEFKSNGTSTVSNCGGQLGDMQRQKHVRNQSEAANGGFYWFPLKLDWEQVNQNKWFYSGGADTTGFVECEDNAVALMSSGGTSGGEQNASDATLVAPSAIGVGDPDTAWTPNGYGASWFGGSFQTYPLKAAKWTRIVAIMEFHVAANSSKLNAWRSDCDWSGSPKKITTSSAANERITTLFAHGLSVSDTVLLWGYEGGSPDINGVHTVASVPTTTTFTLTGVDITADGHDGVVVKKTTTATDTKCANMLSLIDDTDADCAVVDAANCSSHWNLFTAYVIDEDRAAQRIAYRVPWHPKFPGGAYHDLKQVQFQYDASSPSCGNCGDRVMYMRNVMLFVNVPEAQWADDGCEIVTGIFKSCGDTGDSPSAATTPLNLLRKPRR